VPQTLQRALAHHRAGRLTEAEQLYRAILVAAPADFGRFRARGVRAAAAG